MPRLLHFPSQATRIQITRRILARLAEAEAHEPDAWLRDDYRIAWNCVNYAAAGVADPWGFAFWYFYGKHWRALVPEFVERARQHAAMEPSPRVGQPERKGITHVKARLGYREMSQV
jgi:hypothetical protein